MFQFFGVVFSLLQDRNHQAKGISFFFQSVPIFWFVRKLFLEAVPVPGSAAHSIGHPREAIRVVLLLERTIIDRNGDVLVIFLSYISTIFQLYIVPLHLVLLLPILHTLP